MNITCILKQFPKTSETFVLSQIRGLEEHGHRVTVVSLRRPGRENVKPGEQEGRRVFYLDYRRNRIGRLVKSARIALKHAAGAGFLPYAFRTADTLALAAYPAYTSGVFTKSDILLIHYGDLAYRFSFLRDRLGLHTTVAVVFHGVDVARYLPALPAHERSRLWNSMTLGLPVSYFWQERLTALGCPPEKLRVHHMGVDTACFSFRQRELSPGLIRLVSVCRLVEKKGIDLALQSIAGVLKAHPDYRVRYDIVGSGPERPVLETLVRELGIHDAVTFHGEKSHEDTARLLDAADVFILPSRTARNGDMEGIPVSLMEAMACGLPVISTYHSGIPELVDHGVSGLLAGENDVAELQRLINRLIHDRNLVPLLGENARNTVMSRFNQANLDASLDTILRETAGRSGG